MGTKHNHDKNASIPDSFMYNVTEDCKELWSEGVSIYHNPSVFALLSGLGVKRAAQVLAGWEITLDLISKVAAC